MFKKEKILRKINTFKQLRNIILSGEQLPTQFLAYKDKTHDQLEEEINNLSEDINRIIKSREDEAFTNLMEKNIEYQYPTKYRLKMPGYSETLNAVAINKKLTKKILQVRQIEY